MTAPSIRKCVAAAIFASIFFVCAGQPFVPLLGIQNDEALFAGPLFEPLASAYSWRFGHKQIPLMLMTYLGCLKTLIFAPIFKLFGSGAWAIREPTLLCGAISVWLFFLLLRRLAGCRAALIGCWLLAADSIYLLTTCYDWGPVALQHLLLLAGALLLTRFYQNKSEISLALAFLFLGLLVWDKALALWMLGGFAVAGILTFPRQIFAAFTLRRLLLSAAALLLGALPLISYNLQTRLSTIRENTAFRPGDPISKVHILLNTLQGGVLFGFLNAPDEATAAPRPHNGVLLSASVEISALTHNPSSDWLLPALAAAIVIAPLGGRATLRLVLFFLIAMALGWIQMAVNPHTGTSAHHIVLLWPWPQAIIAVSFAAVSRRLGRFGAPAAAAATVLIALSCVLLTNQYYAKIVRNGAATPWSAAVFPLADSVKRIGAEHVFCTDWGYLDTLVLLNRNRPVMRDGSGLAADPAALQWALADPRNLFIDHAPGVETTPGVGRTLAIAAARLGRFPQTMQTIEDDHGRQVFVIYRFP